jgi:Tol biopolymer transport system component
MRRLLDKITDRQLRLAAIGTAVAVVVAAIAFIVVRDDGDGATTVAARDAQTTTTVEEETTTTEAMADVVTTTTTAAPTTTTSSTAPPPTTTTTLPPVRYKTGPADPIQNSHIYVMALADGLPHSVVDYYGVLDRPRWSADGRRILYMGGGLFTIAPDGSGKTAAPAGGNLIETPAWSAKGQMAAVALEGQGNRYDLAVTQLKGSVRSITGDQVGPVSGADWSPDGSRVAFVAGGKVWIANADTSGVHAVTENVKAWRYVEWSRDGSRLAFYAAKATWVVGSDGKGLHQVATSDGYRSFSWAPDARRLAVSQKQGDTYDLGIVSADGGPVQSIGVAAFASSWSPDGASIAYRAWPAAGGIGVVAPDGSGRRTLLAQPADTYFGDGLAWSPDSTHLLLNTGGGGEGGPPEPQ